jgi:hypothetical protein
MVNREPDRLATGRRYYFTPLEVARYVPLWEHMLHI